MRSLLLSVALVLCAAVPVHAAYDQAQGGTVSPSALTAGGQTDYSVSLKGRPAVVDIVFVLDNSGSMSTIQGGPSRWTNLSDRTKAFVDALAASGLFSRGGRIGVVLFSDTATTAPAPTTDVSAIKSGIDGGFPGGGSCIGCGIERATALLTAIPGASSHRQIVYLAADGANTVPSPTLADTVAAAKAAHIERRVMGIDLSSSPELESIDSDGVVAYPGSATAIGQAYAAEPTAYPGATNLAWTFHVSPGFIASSPNPSRGSASVSGQDVTWTLPSLGDETATLTFHATHDATSGCGAQSLLTGMDFSDTEGDAVPGAALGPLSVTGCPGPAGPGSPAALGPPAIGVTPVTLSGVRLSPTRFMLGPAVATIAATRSKTKHGAVLTFTVDRAARVAVRFDHRLQGRRSGTHCVAQTRANRKGPACTRFTNAGSITRQVVAGRHELHFAGRLDAGRALTAGAYRLTMVAAGSAGGDSAPQTLAFTALRGR